MKVSQASIRNFRRLEDVQFSLEDDHTAFVGPNNSGKTSAVSAFRLFFDRGGEFTINDFTVVCISEFDRYGDDAGMNASSLPTIEMDIWLSIDPEVEFGRVFSLLPDVSTDFDKVGIRLRYCIHDGQLLRDEYTTMVPAIEGKRQKSLAQFLQQIPKLSRYFSIRYYALSIEGSETKELEIEAKEGKRTLNSLIRIDFIDAQRNIHDQDSGRANRLSAAFSAYYNSNLEKPANNEAANRVIDENNLKLTAHYDTHFKPLLAVISKLGVPSAHDRTLRLVSSMNAQDALQGSTELLYFDEFLKHELPEAYNGLGFKNLIYIAVQLNHYHAQWLSTESGRELCQLIFIEEPEVHLHAQVQQVFIANISTILRETAKALGMAEVTPQLAISTHSSHIVDAVEFDKIRYFRRVPLKSHLGNGAASPSATKVLNLKDFRPTLEPLRALTAEEDQLGDDEKATLLAELKKAQQQATIDFLKKYLKLTHCDLFFSDAAILVEGTVEKLLLPQMIGKSAKRLLNRYVTILEVGGAYAHRLASLLSFIGIPYVVITDIDTVDAADARKACRADKAGARTSNAALKSLLEKSTRDELIALKSEDQLVQAGQCFVTFQKPVKVGEDEMHGRTLEETFIYENLGIFKGVEQISIGIGVTATMTRDEIIEKVYGEVRDQSFKKTEFALAIASSQVVWTERVNDFETPY
ncbi:ATP-dependent nuclease [Massilia antarctica]|uniref:ATP-dependent nuclease n=1 Tax=Massilia antarctica TaxID=2765360 RepID=UPI00226D6F61|nr:AAA family ATPase [Massilia sp. H27-R4]MCY0916510.1 AAA family ATPase [Massilia sp. H27-R4]